MIKMINKITGTEMWVDDERVIEYVNLGHRKTIPTLDDLTEKKPVTELEKAVKRVSKKKA